MRDALVEEPVRTAPADRHQPWCDLGQHALAEAETVGRSGCVGRYVRYGLVGGWIAEDGQGTRFVVDWRPAEGWESLRPEEAAQLGGLMELLAAESRRSAPRRLFGRGRPLSA